MNWDAIAAVGEILGAAGVIITLGYLAVQVRQNSHQLERNVEATRVAADDAIIRNYNDWRALMIADADTADLYIRGLQDIADLNDSERLRFNYLLSTFGWTAWQLWRVQNLLGTPNAEIFRHLLRHPGGRDWWALHRVYFPEDFRAGVDDVRQQLEQAGEPDLLPEESSSMLAGAIRMPCAGSEAEGRA